MRLSPTGWLWRLLEELETRQYFLHHHEVWISSPNFKMIFDAQRGDDGIRERHREATGVKRRKRLAYDVPDSFGARYLLECAEESQ